MSGIIDELFRLVQAGRRRCVNRGLQIAGDFGGGNELISTIGKGSFALFLTGLKSLNQIVDRVTKRLRARPGSKVFLSSVTPSNF